MLCALSQLLPPTAIVGKVACEVLGVDDYGRVLRVMMPYIVLTALFSLLFVIGSNAVAGALV